MCKRFNLEKMEDAREYSGFVFVNAGGILTCEFCIKDVMFTERIRGEISGLIEFEGKPEFCDEEHVYYWGEE